MLRPAVLASLLCLSCYVGLSQNQLYSYQQLSRIYYAAQEDSLKKAWVCPEVLNDRSAQKMLKQLWEERTSFVTTAIEKQYFVY